MRWLLSVLVHLRARIRQRSLVRTIARSGIRYSDGAGTARDDPVVITGARTDVEGTGAVFAWMFEHLGTMDVDWRILGKNGAYGAPAILDIYHVQTRDGHEYTLYFDITDHYLKR